MTDAAPDSLAARDVIDVRSFVANRDVECPACRYNLRDLPSDRCPECGEQLVLRLTPVEPKQAACIAGLIGLAAGAGFSGLLLVYIFIMLASRGMPSQGFMSFFVITISGLAVETALLLVWLRKWKAIRRLGALPKSLLVIGCFGTSLLNLALFTALIL